MTSVETDSVAGLLAELRRYPLLTPHQLQEASRFGARCPDGLALARELVQRRWLSSLQANLLLSGRGLTLFFGPYLLLDRLGEGATGQVFKARHVAMQRVVALKVLRPELLTDSEIVRRFHREVQVISQLSHPHIVHALDAGQNNGAHYLVMEYVEGADLEQIVKRNGPLSVPLACYYMQQAALGLQHAHEKGLVHRDIKPSNLLVTTVAQQRSASQTARATAVVKILDLGLARVPRQRSDDAGAALTLAGKGMMGTPDYLAPEQALDFSSADIRSDLYSLGCTFYFLLTGQPPFANGTLAQKLMKHQQAEPPPSSNFRPDVPVEVQNVVRRLLAKRPADRFQTPAELANALQPIVERSPAVAASTVGRSDPTMVLAGGIQSARSWNLRRLVGGTRRRLLAACATCLLSGAALLGLVSLLGSSPLDSAGRATSAYTWRTLATKSTEAEHRVVPGNVALATTGATVIGPGGPAAEVIDGVTTGYTGYTGFSQGSWPCSWTVTLPHVYLLQEVRLLLWDGNRRNYRYTIEVSLDGKTFRPLVDRSAGDWRSWQTITFSPRAVKHIRVQGLYNSDNQAFHIVELEAYCIPPTRPAVPRFPSVPPPSNPVSVPTSKVGS